MSIFVTGHEEQQSQSEIRNLPIPHTNRAPDESDGLITTESATVPDEIGESVGPDMSPEAELGRRILVENLPFVQRLSKCFAWPEGKFYGHSSMDRTADEIAQRTSEKLLRNPDRLANAVCVRAYLVRMVKNAANEISRKAYRRMKVCQIVGESMTISQENDHDEFTVSNLDYAATVECPQYENLNYRESIQLFQDLRDQYVLKDRRRALDIEAFMLHEFEGMSFIQIAERQGCKRQAASARHGRIKKFFRGHCHLFV